MSYLKQSKHTECVTTRAANNAPETKHHPRSSDLMLDLLSLQHVAGNQAVTRLLQPHDADEQEAERVAHQVANGSPTQNVPSEIRLLPPITPLPTSDALLHHLGSGAPLPPFQRASFEKQ